MENVSKAIGTILKANTGVTDIVGAGNIFHARIPQNNQEDTVLRFFVDDVDPIDVKNHSPTLFNCYVRIEMYSNNDQDLTELATEVREALDRYAHGEVNGVFLAGVQYLRGKHYPDEPDMIDEQSYVQMYKFRVDIGLQFLTMNYQLSEQDTGDKWVNSAAVYERTWDLGAATGATDITGLTKTWSVLEWTLVEVRGVQIFIKAVLPTADGTTDWKITLNASDTQSYFWARYIKETAS